MPDESQHYQHYKNGDTLYQKGKFRDAVQEFEVALKFLPNDYDTLWAIAGCYSELRQPDLAEQFYKKALTVCPENKREELIYNIGNSLFDQKKYKEAIKLYESISKKSGIYKKAKRNINAAKRQSERY